MKDLYIIGAGGFGREVAWLVERINAVKSTWNIKGFIDDNSVLWGKTEDGYPIAGGSDFLLEQKREIWTVCAVGNAKVRQNLIKKLDTNPNIHFATVIDPSVILSGRVIIGEGSIVCAGSILTVDITIGKHVIINLDCTLGHDDVISDFVTIYPSVNVSGNVIIGACAELGTGMQIIQGKRIGKGSILGAGTVVVKDIPDGCTAVGSPARVIKIEREKMNIYDDLSKI